MIKYFKSYIDNNKFNHSIDMVKVFYDCSGTIENILLDFQAIKEKNVISPSEYWEKLNCTPCAKWNYWYHHLHIGDVYVRIGRYKLKDEIGERDYRCLTCICVEVNPNKHYDKPVFNAVMEVVNKYNQGGYIMQVDYAIDICCNIDDVVVLKTRKEKGLYKGTRYFGCRGQNGFVKIYNKGVESNLNYPLTRIETCWKLKDKFSSVDFGIIQKNVNQESSKLSLSTGLILEMLQELRLLGSANVDDYLSRMNYKTRIQIQASLNENIVKYEYNGEYLNKLIKDIEQLFCVSGLENVYEDSEGFLACDDFDVPW